jgi:N-acetylmuramic acid 6-phosphate etherase
MKAAPGVANDLPATETRSDVALDQLDPRGLAERFAAEDARAVEAVRRAGPAVARAIELAADALGRGGRVILAGAGTSGRLAVLEASEIHPTFSSDRVVGLLAGGPAAFLQAIEGAEDDRDAGRAAIAALVTQDDLVIGVAASGRTPWTLGVLEGARLAKARTGLVACASPPAGLEVDVVVVLETGPEVLSGSTRLKAGTATKCVLNAITTGAMARVGKVMDDLMVDMHPSNEKLRARAARIVGTLVPCDAARAVDLLRGADGEIKVAIVMGRLALDGEAARAALATQGGHLRRTLDA